MVNVYNNLIVYAALAIGFTKIMRCYQRSSRSRDRRAHLSQARANQARTSECYAKVLLKIFPPPESKHFACISMAMGARSRYAVIDYEIYAHVLPAKRSRSTVPPAAYNLNHRLDKSAGKFLFF